MDLRQLEILRAIVETGSFTAAAEKLHVSQSAVSRQVILLENELGETVFHRIGRRIRITKAGESLLHLSQRVFKDITDTVGSITDKQETLYGPLHLVGGMSVCLYVFPVLLAKITSLHPNLDLKITSRGPEGSIAALQRGLCDLGLITLPISATDLVSVSLFEEELVLITYPTHPLTKRQGITAMDLRNEPFILFESGSVTRRLVEDFFIREKIEFRLVMETENVEIMKAMVRAGLGCSIIPWQAAANDVKLGRLSHLDIKNQSLRRETGWVYQKVGQLPRVVSEVIRLSAEARPMLEAAARVPPVP